MYGIDVKYLPRTQENLNKFFGEDQSTKFENAYEMVVIPEGLSSYNEGSDLLGKFGFSSNYTITLFIEKERFVEETNNALTRPRIGDLIWIPTFNCFFEITYANDREEFYHLGKTYVFKMEVSQWRYSHEEISTGDPDVDDNTPTETISTDRDNEIIDDLDITDAISRDYDEDSID